MDNAYWNFGEITKEILEEAMVEPITTVMRRSQGGCRTGSGTIKEGWYRKHPSSCRNEGGGEGPYRKTEVEVENTIRRDLKAWSIREDGPLTGKYGNVSARHPSPHAKFVFATGSHEVII